MSRKLAFDVYNMDTKVGRVELDGLHLIKNEMYFDPKEYKFPFMINPFYSLTDPYIIWSYIESRVVPANRANIKRILKIYGMKEYDAIELAKKTHALNCDDMFWFKFDDVPDDHKTWRDLNPRRV